VGFWWSGSCLGISERYPLQSVAPGSSCAPAGSGWNLDIDIFGTRLRWPISLSASGYLCPAGKITIIEVTVE